jgi:hydrogenase-4 component B
MPHTAICFAFGAVAICGLPPLNGFVSELLVYVGLFRTLGIGDGPAWPAACFAAPALALIGALAVACFVKAYGAVFLGSPRTDHARLAHESGPTMITPMFVLVACCLVIGLAPPLVAPMLQQAVVAWSPALGGDATKLADLVPLGWVSAAAIALVVAIAAGWFGLRAILRRSEVGSAVTWDCGYAAPSPTMQYTSSSFAEMLVKLFAWALRPKIHVQAPKGLFDHEGKFHSHVPDTVLDGAIEPSIRGFAWLLSRLRVLQAGSIQLYLVYIFIVLVVLLLWKGWM